jgi:amino acid adenylation domain-containing protein
MTGTIHEAMDLAAERTPDAPVLRFARTTLTYNELARRSERLAALLQSQGVRRGDRVGLYFNKSIESVIALYGVMKAGAAYVPLDPNAPAARTSAIIDQCDIEVLISHPPKAHDLAKVISHEGVALRCVVGLNDPLPGPPVTLSWDDVEHGPAFKRPEMQSDDLAYILFTSGSTGVPKGIMHTHRSGLAYANYAADLYDVQPGDRLSNHPPLHFDMSLFDYFSGPIRGACTVIIPEPYTKLPASLSGLMESERLSHWYSVPFALIQLIEHGVLEQRDLRSLRWVVFAGEPFLAKHLKALMSLLPEARFSNSYGPTELNQCTYHHVSANDLSDGRSPPIGRVWDGVESLVVDDQNREVAVGERGELLVRSPTAMSGYWRRPDLSEKAFYARPGHSDMAEFFYRTGDLVVDEGGGVYRFHGRKDRQIKLRGFRIELDEVEAALACHEAVDEVAAILIPGDNGSDCIVAAATLKPGFDASIADEIRTTAADRLPAYALPERIDILDSLPRTATEKIDRNILAHEIKPLDRAEGSRT